MAENDNPGLSRRKFLRLAALATGGLLAAPLASGCSDSSLRKERRFSSTERSFIPESIRAEILTDEELAKANIQINPSHEVKLYLRNNAFEAAVFKDAADKKIGGVVISLIDDDKISWGTVASLPNDAITVWRKVNADKNPQWWSESFWQQLREYVPKKIDYYQNVVANSRRDYLELIRGETEKKARASVELYKSVIAQDKAEQRKDLEYWQKKLEDILSGREKKRISASEHDARLDLANAKGEQEILQGPRSKAIDYYTMAGLGAPQGQLINPYPEWQNKAYIYLVVGGDYKPRPDQSYPGPDDFIIFPRDQGYAVYSDEKSIGAIAHHEVRHYEEHEEDKDESERKADVLAYEGLMQKWFPFIFVTKDGATITQAPKREQLVGV